MFESIRTCKDDLPIHDPSCDSEDFSNIYGQQFAKSQRFNCNVVLKSTTIASYPEAVPLESDQNTGELKQLNGRQSKPKLNKLLRIR